MEQHPLVARFGRASLLALVGVLMANLASAQPAPAATAAELPVTRLVLFTNGVGYFEHEGTVTGDQVLTLDVPQADMDDLLQSLVLQDFGGGTVRPVRYTAQDPLARVLDGYRIDVSGNLTLAGVLAQARGATVTLVGGRTVTGAVVGVEQVQQTDREPRSYVTVVTATGLVRAPLDEFEEVRFADPELKSQLDEALTAIAERAGEDASKVRISFEGEGERRVRVGYLREMPVWKSTYRLVVGDDGKGTLQGWAILDNPTNVPLEDVNVSFVAGQPISFITSLFEPRYLSRPRVETELAGNVVPRADAGAFPAAAASAAGGAFRMAEMAPPSPAPYLADVGVTAQASTAGGGATFSYDVTQPVTVGAFESAMVPIVVTEVTATPVSLFDEATLADHPLRAVRLTNDTGLHLAAGTVTLFDARGFAGTAQLTDLLPGDSRLLQYAVDLAVKVLRTSTDVPERVVAVKLQGGLVETTVATRRVTTVTIDSTAEEPRFLIVALPRLAGYDVVAPKPAPPLTDANYRFGVSLGGAADTEVPTHATCTNEGACVLEAVFDRTELRRTALANVDLATLALYLENADLSAADRATIQQVADLQRQVAARSNELTGVESTVAAIHQEQARITDNMSVLEKDSPLYRRYVTDLTNQEDELARLLERGAALRDEIQALSNRVADLIAGLGD